MPGEFASWLYLVKVLMFGTLLTCITGCVLQTKVNIVAQILKRYTNIRVVRQRWNICPRKAFGALAVARRTGRIAASMPITSFIKHNKVIAHYFGCKFFVAFFIFPTARS